MNDPEIHSSTWDWDTASTTEAWKHSHNYVHHTYTNIRGKDKDLGYEIMRIDPHQKWHPVYLLQPFYNVLLMALFEWGVAFHDLDFEAIRTGEKSKKQVREELKGIARQGADARSSRTTSPGRCSAGWRWARSAAALAAAPSAARREAAARRADRRRLPARPRAAGRERARQALAAFARRVQALVPVDAVGRRHRQHRPQRLVVRDHLLRPLPRPDLHLQPGGGRGRDAGRLVRAPAASAPPTSRAARCSTSHQRQPRLPGRAPPLSRTCRSTRYAEIAPQGQGRSASATGCPTTRPVRASSGDGAADDPPARVPRRQAAAEAGPLPRHRDRGARRRRARTAGRLSDRRRTRAPTDSRRPPRTSPPRVRPGKRLPVGPQGSFAGTGLTPSPLPTTSTVRWVQGAQRGSVTPALLQREPDR